MVIIILTIAALVIAAAYICYRLGFTVPQQVEADLFKFPDTEQYAPFREEMTAMVKAALAIPYEDVWITSGDGLKLHGKCYTSTPDAPVQIMFHRTCCTGKDEYDPSAPETFRTGKSWVYPDLLRYTQLLV